MNYNLQNVGYFNFLWKYGQKIRFIAKQSNVRFYISDFVFYLIISGSL